MFPPRAFAGLVGVLAACLVVQAQEGQGPFAARPLDLPSASGVLDDFESVESWVVSALPEVLGLRNGESLVVRSGSRSLGGHEVYALSRLVEGIPVANREMRLVLDEARRPARLHGSRMPLPAPTSEGPVLGVDDALSAVPGLQSEIPSGRLVYWLGGGSLRLAYELDSGSAGAVGMQAERVYVDARTGTVLQRMPLVHRGLDRRAYDFAAACDDLRIRRKISMRRFAQVVNRAMSRHSRTERSAPGSPPVERVFGMLQAFHEFLGDTLEMDSLDGRGGPLSGFVGVRATGGATDPPQCIGDLVNAFWHDQAKAAFVHPDIIDHETVGHEFGHGIVSEGSGLIYTAQSGALNESIADAVGVSFRAWKKGAGRGAAGLSGGLSERDWQIRLLGHLIRDMGNPSRVTEPVTRRPLPDHFSEYRYMREDNFGVHVNSSIMNHGFYLLAEGGQHRRLRLGREVQGIGLAKALRIYGRAASDLLTPNAGFEAARYAFADVARMTFGQQSAEWVATHMAMDAIGIPGTWDRSPTKPEPAAPEAPDPVEDVRDEVSPVPPDKAGQPSDPEPPQDPLQSKPPASDPRAPAEPASRREVTSDEEPSGREAEQSPAGPRPEREDTTVPQHPEAEGRSIAILWWMLAIAVLAAVLYLVAKLRPGERNGAPRIPGDPPGRDNRTREGPRNTPERGPIVGGHLTPGLAATLMPSDGPESIPLSRELLESREGLIVGRSASLCHLAIRGSQVSRRHVRLRIVHDQIQIEDLNSSAGTRVDGVSVAPFTTVSLSPGQSVQIGDVSYKFRSA